MITKIIEVWNETLYGKERLRMEVLGLKTDLDSYKAIAAKFKADTDYWRYSAETAQDSGETLLVELREQQSYTMELVKKLNETRRIAKGLAGVSQLPAPTSPPGNTATRATNEATLDAFDKRFAMSDDQ